MYHVEGGFKSPLNLICSFSAESQIGEQFES